MGRRMLNCLMIQNGGSAVLWHFLEYLSHCRSSNIDYKVIITCVCCIFPVLEQDTVQYRNEV